MKKSATEPAVGWGVREGVCEGRLLPCAFPYRSEATGQMDREFAIGRPLRVVHVVVVPLNAAKKAGLIPAKRNKP